jgi:hypothetical protein
MFVEVLPNGGVIKLLAIVGLKSNQRQLKLSKNIGMERM